MAESCGSLRMSRKEDGDIFSGLAALLNFDAASLLAFAADFFAALPPLAPESCRCSAGFSVLDPFLFEFCLRYLVVDFTPSSRAESARTQMNPLLQSSVGCICSTLLKAYNIS